MNVYFRSPVPFIAPLIFGTLMLGGMGIALVAVSPMSAGAVLGGIVCLAMLASIYWFTVWSVSNPAVQVIDDRLEVRGVFGHLYRIDPINEFELVLSNSWVGFRRKGDQDITIDKARFSKKTWLALESQLRQLPFARIV